MTTSKNNKNDIPKSDDSNFFIEWLISDLESEGKGKNYSDKEIFRIYFDLVWRCFLVLIAIIVPFVLITISTEFLTSSIPYFNDSFLQKFRKGIDVKLDGATIASYFGIAIGSVVALVGSFVAIKLSILALKSSNEQIALSEEQSRLAVSSTPEYGMGLEAAIAYIRFKSFMVLHMMSQRTRQRDGNLSQDAIKGVANTVPLDTESNTLSTLVDDLLKTSLPFLMPSIAKKNAGEDFQRKLEMILAALTTKNNFIRQVTVGTRFTREADSLIELMWKPWKDEKAEDGTLLVVSYDKYEKLYKGPVDKKLQEVEFWFIWHMKSYSQLNRDLGFSDSVNIKRIASENISGSLTVIDKSNNIGSTIKEFLSGDGTKNAPKAIVLASIDDITLFTVLAAIRDKQESPEFVALENDIVPSVIQFTSGFVALDNDIEPSVSELTSCKMLRVCFSTDWHTKLARLLDNMKNAAKEPQVAMPKVVLVLDQIEMYNDENTKGNLAEDPFNLSEHLQFWKLCVAISEKAREIKKTIDNQEKLRKNRCENETADYKKKIAELNALDKNATNKTLLQIDSEKAEILANHQKSLEEINAEFDDKKSSLEKIRDNITYYDFNLTGDSINGTCPNLNKSQQIYNILNVTADELKIEFEPSKHKDRENYIKNHTSISFGSVSSYFKILELVNKWEDEKNLSDSDINELKSLAEGIEFPAEFSLSKENIKKLKQSSPINFVLSENQIKIINELAKRPLFDRPFYGKRVMENTNHIMGQMPDKLPENLQIVAIGYFNSDLQWKMNPFMEWLMASSSPSTEQPEVKYTVYLTE